MNQSVVNSSAGVSGEDLLFCPDFSAATVNSLANFAFWTDGVAKTAIAIVGIAGNV